MELPIRLSKQSREPFYHQMEQQIKALIVSGQLPPKTSLPSIRALSKDLEVSVITTRRAYQNLEYQGFIQTTQGKGTFVAEIESTLRETTQHDIIHQAMQTAVQTAKQHKYTNKQILDLCQQLIREEE
ncbi:GntR family transcriptional regulator [Halalkalibacillus halophilus]|uniref:GntR family transcriptional regulator n=1 Tax=Halalkalibacillus halophilus TaxID=392827 RepID=UPI000400FAAC|nr:GntR family transcriptional regulator [Halalkalibacillus halophilus]